MATTVTFPFSRSWRRVGCASALLFFGLSAQAGLSLDQALARHRALLDLDAGETFGFVPLAAPPDGAAVILGGPTDAAAALLAPVVRHRGGARVVVTPLDGTQSDGGTRLRLGLTAADGASGVDVLEGSALGTSLGAGQVYASVERRHWGPGWMGSLILDAAAPALAGVGWRKTSATEFQTPWLSWLGRWNADFFVARLSGHSEPAHPRLVGMRVQVQPMAGLEIGASRTMQWGGSGRDNSLKALVTALVGRDNGPDPGEDPGNQLAGFDMRYGGALLGGHGALYGQFVGEDEAGLMPSQWLGLVGVEWAGRSAGSDHRFFVEYADTIAGHIGGNPRYGHAYRHHTYLQGYTHDGLPLGHALGGDARLASAGLLHDGGRVAALLVLHAGRSAPTSQWLAPDARLAGLNAAASLQFDAHSRIGIGLWWWRAGSERSTALQAWWHTDWR
jgi:hypothetical protein